MRDYYIINFVCKLNRSSLLLKMYILQYLDKKCKVLFVLSKRHSRYLSQRERSLKPGEKHWRDYKVQFTEEKHLSLDWGRAEEWKSISLETRGLTGQTGVTTLLTAPVVRLVIVYESLASLSKETSFLAVISEVK